MPHSTTSGTRADKGLMRFLAAPPPTERLDDTTVAKRYPRLRLQVFLGIFIGYAGYYLIRNNIPLVGSLLIDEGRLDELGIGIIANAALIAYGFSKFLSATVSDRSNARYFLPIGLLLSAVANLVVAFVPAVSASLALFAIVMFINGWVQGMGWPPCGRVLVHWFSTNERGIKTSIWNVAHNVGGFAVGVLAAIGLSLTGNDWTAAFWLPALVAIVVAVVAFFLVRDTPESQGLPTIEEYRDDPAKVEDAAGDAELGMWAVVRKHVIRNRTMVLLALANVFVYALRYGVLTWTPIYLSQVRGASLAGGIAGFSLFELAGIVGTLLCGWASDKIFRGNRSLTGITFMVAVGIAVAVYWLTPASAPLWVSLVAVTFIGGLIYGPVMLIGLQALDLSPRRVAGTAAGFTGLFGYVLGATLASSGIGLVVQNFGWDVTFVMLLVFVVITVVFFVIINKDEKIAIEAHRRRTDARA
ncbi:sn-glycerol-3-phosphate transporter [Arthrobacter sp. RIT-PI-e]|uniref:MFS transporter n=1 Tax=Arthrobacter sp. RIT-PI-e TaxID=1681197 RepID=UPI0006764DAF|nr:MFS transporter [Arthrobacter sp. RIT-PI-e]KNC18565.1 sn-glycerol-3-phosphate transporter [Arthrobacter sp. RIT-PI-e]